MTEMPYADLDPWRPGRLFRWTWGGEPVIYVVVEMSVRELAQQQLGQPARVMLYESAVEIELRRIDGADAAQLGPVTDMSSWGVEESLVTVGGTDWRLWRAQSQGYRAGVDAPEMWEIHARAQARMP